MRYKSVGLFLFLPTLAVILFLLACSDGIGPSATENLIAGSINFDELSGVSTTDIRVYLVEFQSGGMARVDSVHPDFTGRYEFVGFDFGNYGVEASTPPVFSPDYYGFRDGNHDGIFGSSDAIVFSSFGHVDYFNVPLYGDFPDTNHFEFEPNDDAFLAQDLDIIHAAHIDGDVSFGGFTPPDQYDGDLDLYRFKSVWDGYMIVELYWSASADLDLFIYDGSGYSVLESATTDGLGPERIYRSVYRGEEFIVLAASVDYASSYELSINIE